MLRISRCVTGIARLRIGSNASAVRHCTTRAAPQAVIDTTAADLLTLNEVLVGWPGAYRLDINNVIREISLDAAYLVAAKQRYHVALYCTLFSVLSVNKRQRISSHFSNVYKLY